MCLIVNIIGFKRVCRIQKLFFVRVLKWKTRTTMSYIESEKIFGFLWQNSNSFGRCIKYVNMESINCLFCTRNDFIVLPQRIHSWTGWTGNSYINAPEQWRRKNTCQKQCTYPTYPTAFRVTVTKTQSLIYIKESVSVVLVIILFSLSVILSFSF